MFRLLLRRLSTAAENHVAASASSSPYPPLRRPLSGDLYRRIAEVGSPHLPLAPVLGQWALEGHTVEKHVLQAIVKKLIGLRRFAHALELSFWMTNQRHFYLSPGDVAYRLQLITKVHGLECAVEYFGTVPTQLRKHHCYVSLLKCYGEAKAVEKAEELFVKMQEMGMKGAYAYNLMMKLYLETGQLERVHAMFWDMEEKGIEPDMFCVENLLAAYIAAEDVEGVGKLLEKANPRHKLLSWQGHASAAMFFMKARMQERAFKALLDAERLITPKNGKVAYSYLLNAYTDLGMYPEVDRIWDVYKSKVPPCRSMYLCRISVLLKMNEIDRAEKALKEWETKCVFFYDFKLMNLVVDAYCREGLVRKAVALVDEAIEKGRKPAANTWYRLADGCFKNGEVLKAVDMTRLALASATIPLESDMTYVLMSLNHFMDQKDVEAAEEMMSMLQKLIPLSRDVYCCLLKIYVRAGKPVCDLLDRMKKDGLEADEETDRILAGEFQ
ncbi:pentatricopeptide repeat-containing protein At2g20710, mitochondrial-like [Phragmites australis]|uniref:pentatricopeptide repeat-containing protein At2g20710, mitochondrial-like n=1 Tax=Phragmites australis TaxID=29695 RepID=UPI002D7A0B5F|nr:pentatricopeptide repeat-containing protein At2g20710, mitochondrial-like [Phragmites australis]XP_062205065.1 pentatricopeptide repeat-containing protein At2g20710, mitochondrial-like [Phragmites australis]XP_062205066.1 pentatricopeptide repeat-containing protein At2g20710, mitochondrial-like [Phragmites australis]